MLTILRGVAAWEREIILERQRAGIDKAVAEGRYSGRPAVYSHDQIAPLSAKGMTPREIAAILKCDKTTLTRALAKARNAALALVMAEAA